MLGKLGVGMLVGGGVRSRDEIGALSAHEGRLRLLIGRNDRRNRWWIYGQR